MYIYIYIYIHTHNIRQCLLPYILTTGPKPTTTLVPSVSATDRSRSGRLYLLLLLFNISLISSIIK